MKYIIREDKHSLYMNYILKTLLDKRNCQQEDVNLILDKFSINDFISVLKKNVVLVRFLEKVYPRLSDELRKEFDPILKKEQVRRKKTLEIIDKINQKFEEENLPVMIIKTLDNYPDLGHDVDIYTEAPIKKVDKILIDELKARFISPTFSDRLARKRNYKLESFPTLEIHCGRLGQVGEQNKLSKELIPNYQKIKIDRISTFIPRTEHRLLLVVLQRMYRHFNIRLCDIYNTFNLLEENLIDWRYLRETSDKYGLWNGILLYLQYISKVCSCYGYYFSAGKGIDVKRNWPNRIITRHMHFRFPLFSTAFRLYFKKLSSDIKQSNIYSCSRLPLIVPLSLAHYLSAKLLKRSNVW